MNKYIHLLLTSKKVKNFIKKNCFNQGRPDLEKDLLQFCIVKLLDKDEAPPLNEKNIEDYFIGIVRNQIVSNTSEFYKDYRNGGFGMKVKLESDDYFNLESEDETDYDWQKDKKLDSIEKALLYCDPLKVDLFKMKYYEERSYLEIAHFYNIKIASVRNKVSAVRTCLKNILLQGADYSRFGKKQNHQRRIKQGKLPITDEVIIEMIKKWKSGTTKKELSIFYQVSYPFILKIIKNYDFLVKK